MILDGKKVRDDIARVLQAKIEALASRPSLAIIQVGNREESTAYIGRKRAFAESIGVEVRHIGLQESVSEEELISSIHKLNSEQSIHGIILQLPIPASFSKQKLLDEVVLEKDVDGLATGSRFVPATARGIAELLEFYDIQISGKKVAVLGRSTLVGAPTAKLLKAKGAKVTVCHSQTPNTKEITRASDIIIVAIGKPKFIGRDYFRDDKTQVVIDVGITAVINGGIERLEDEIPERKLVGDVDFEAVKDIVVAISPVPGGVGPMTVAALFENLLVSYKRHVNLKKR